MLGICNVKNSLFKNRKMYVSQQNIKVKLSGHISFINVIFEIPLNKFTSFQHDMPINLKHSLKENKERISFEHNF